MKIIYFADGPWAHLAFDRILEQNIEVALMVLRYDTRDSVLQEKALQNDIQCTWGKNVNDPEFIHRLRELNADLGVSMSFNQIFKKDLIELFPLGLINCHAGKLPNYRGRNILNWALINDEKEIGVTCHYVDEGVDTGDIIHQQSFGVNDTDDYGTVLKKAYEACSNVLLEAIEQIRNGTVNRVSQNPGGTYFIRRKTGDEFINWNWDSRRIFNFVRAITSPGPYAQSWLETDKEYVLIFIKKVRMVQQSASYICSNGGIVGKSETGNPLVKTGDTILEILDYEIDLHKKTTLQTGDRMGLNPDLLYLWKNR